MGTKVSVYKYFGIERVLILAVLSVTILAFGKGSVRRDYYLCSGNSIDLFDPFVLNFGEA